MLLLDEFRSGTVSFCYHFVNLTWYVAKMGNHNSSGSPRKAHENKKLANSDSGKVEKTCVKGPRKRRRRRRCGQVSDNFIIHGIDYLPESVKRKERKKKNVPKFIFFEDHLWQVNRLNFFARFQNGHSHGNGSTVDHKMPEKEPKAIDADPSLVTSSMTRSKTACAGFSEEKIMDWRTYPDYPFRNIVMSGGGSKGYAYIGSLKVCREKLMFLKILVHWLHYVCKQWYWNALGLIVLLLIFTSY